MTDAAASVSFCIFGGIIMEASTRQTLARISSELGSIGQFLQLGRFENANLLNCIRWLDSLIDSINSIKEAKTSAMKRKIKEGLFLYKEALLFILQTIETGAELDATHIQKINKYAEIKIQQGVREMTKRV
jgi:hypothetical protein